MVSAPVRRRQARYAMVSQRRACALLQVARSSLDYASRREVKDAELLEKLRGIARARPRFGYRRASALLRREGPAVNAKRVHRLWKKEGLALSRRRLSKRLRLGQQRQPKPEGNNSVSAWDFVHDACAKGQKLKCLTDEHSRECPAIDVAGRISATCVIEVLSRLVAVHGPPKYLRSDNGPEFIAKALRRWLEATDIQTAYSDPGKPWQNGTNESFNGRFRDESLSAEWFATRRAAVVLIEAWRRDYNEERPQQSRLQDTRRGRSSQCPCRPRRIISRSRHQQPRRTLVTRGPKNGGTSAWPLTKAPLVIRGDPSESLIPSALSGIITSSSAQEPAEECLFTHIDLPSLIRGSDTACERIPDIPAVYAFFRRIPNLSKLAPESFVARIETLVGTAASPAHEARVGPLHSVTLIAASELSRLKTERLEALSHSSAFRDYLGQTLESATFLQAPLYVGKAVQLRERVRQHLEPMSDLSLRLRSQGVSLGETVLAYAEVALPEETVSDVALTLVEEIVTRICRPGYVGRIG